MPAPSISPLRYPGGKANLSPYLADLFMSQYGLLDVEIWVEPFAGGLGAGLTLLERNVVDEVWFCEKNPALAAMWLAIIDDVAELAARVRHTTPTLTGFYEARERVNALTGEGALEGLDRDVLMDAGYAAFILNRCSFSGIVAPTVGPLGGKNQTGKYTVASRFDADRLADRLLRLAPLAKNLKFRGTDATSYIAGLDGSVGIETEMVIFADPPYSDVGNVLYAQGMSVADHQGLADAFAACDARWVLTYDSSPCVLDWYRDRRIMEFGIRHHANTAHVDTEYMIMSDNLDVDPTMFPTKLGGTWISGDLAGADVETRMLNGQPVLF